MIKDLVSVIIPTYNRAHLIKRSAMSVLNQTYGNLELIIIDDGSTDNTEEVVKSIDDERVIYIKQSNKGACAARNNGIDHAKGEFIAFQDSDDIWHKDKLEKQLGTLKNTGADLVCCKMLGNGDATNVIPNTFTEGFLTYSDDVPLGISTQTLCAYSKVFKTERFDVEIPRLQDFELLLRVKDKFKIYCTEDVLIDYYIQEDSISKQTKKLLKTVELISKKHKKCRYSNAMDKILWEILVEISRDTNPINKRELYNHFKKLQYLKIKNKVLLYFVKSGLYSMIKKIANKNK